MHAEFFGKRDNVVAALQPLDCHLSECLGIPSDRSPLRQLQFLSLQNVPIASVSILGFSPKKNGLEVIAGQG
jgi:hypothetical protein